MDSLTELFCLVDDFCREFEPTFERQLLAEGKRRRRRPSALSLSELMTLIVVFHQVRFRQFKAFYLMYACRYLRQDFPHLPSYSRLVELLPRCVVPLTVLFECLKGDCSGISIADSTPIKVCHNRRIQRHRVFKQVAARGKSSMGWFFGFKLHIVINHAGELLAIKLTPGNTDDRQPLPELCAGLFGKLYADKGYISQKLSDLLDQDGLELITKVRRNMKPRQYSAFDQALLRQRSLVETVFDELKNLAQIEHTRHRSVANFLVNLMAGIIAYCLFPHKPRLSLADVRVLDKQASQPALIPN